MQSWKIQQEQQAPSVFLPDKHHEKEIILTPQKSGCIMQSVWKSLAKQQQKGSIETFLLFTQNSELPMLSTGFFKKQRQLCVMLKNFPI